jgi:hypothetical protein
MTKETRVRFRFVCFYPKIKVKERVCLSTGSHDTNQKTLINNIRTTLYSLNIYDILYIINLHCKLFYRQPSRCIFLSINHDFATAPNSSRFFLFTKRKISSIRLLLYYTRVD